MPTDLENLKTRRSAITAELAAITSSKTSGSVDGQSEQHDQHRLALLQELKELNELIASSGFNSDGTPWTAHTRINI